MNEWIKVRDKFPPEDVAVLALWKGGVTGFCPLLMTWNYEFGWQTPDFPHIHNTITHWMPLPGVPRGMD